MCAPRLLGLTSVLDADVVAFMAPAAVVIVDYVVHDDFCVSLRS